MHRANIRNNMYSEIIIIFASFIVQYIYNINKLRIIIKCPTIFIITQFDGCVISSIIIMGLYRFMKKKLKYFVRSLQKYIRDRDELLRRAII